MATDIQNQLCDDCKALVTDILSGSTTSSDSWQVLQSGHATLSHGKHLDGTVVALQRSSRGCRLCTLILYKVHHLDPYRLASHYCISIWGKTPDKAEFQVATTDISVFTKHVSQWQPLKSLTLFAQLTRTPALSELTREIPSGSSNNQPFLSHLPPNDSGSPEAFQKARQWLEDCRNSHTGCSRPASKLPKRVLDLGSPGEALKPLYILREVKLSLTQHFHTPGVKRTGGEPPPSSSHLVQHLAPLPKLDQTDLKFTIVSTFSPDDIPLDAFPQTLRDGLRIAKELGFQYIWIDSLCILQGDKKDWAEQGAAMTDIYGGATLVISASSTQSSDKGMLKRLQNDRIGIGTLRNHDSSKMPMEIYVGDPMKTLDLEQKFISTRAWVFQERLVSAATLHYTNEGMVWECAQSILLDHDQNHTSVRWKTNWQKVMRQASLGHSKGDFAQALGKNNRNEIWYEWINAYSERNLYDSKDKFPALAGVAKTFAQVSGMSNEGIDSQPNYIAGLWKEDFVTGLLWRRHNRTETLISLRDEYIAPSWSWGSVKGRLEYRSAVLIDSINKGPTLKVHEYNVSEEFAGSYGCVLPGGSIFVEGLLQPVTVDRHSHPGVRQRPYQECGVSKGFLNGENVLCSLDVYVENAPQYLECWCLRIGSYDLYGREGDLFLLLERIDGRGNNNEFRRIGFAETDAWWDRMAPTPNSGLLVSGSLTNLTIK